MRILRGTRLLACNEDDAPLPLGGWPRFMAMAQRISEYARSSAEQRGCEKSTEQLASHMDSASQPGQEQRFCGDQNGSATSAGEGCAPAGSISSADAQTEPGTQFSSTALRRLRDEFAMS